MILIREYRPSDFETLLCFDDRPSERRMNKLVALSHVPSWYGYVADEGDETLGFVIMEDLGEGSHYMVQINVKTKRKRTGTQLVGAVFNRIGLGGHISLCVNTDNLPAIAFYESLGFQRSGFVGGYRKNQDKFWYAIDI